MYRQGLKIIKLLDKHSVNMHKRNFYKTHGNSISNKMKNSFQQGEFMNKVMNKNAPSKPWYPARAPKNESMNIMKERLVNPHVTRRVIVLNKLFMKHVTDLMAAGDIAMQTLGRGIEISKVHVTNDFKIVRVYWFSSYTDILDETSAILEKIAYQLRHELTQLRVIGVVPLIQFVKDAKLKNIIDLENRFLTADYGEDYIPKITVAPKRQLTLYTQLPKEVQEKIRKLNSTIQIDKEELEDDETYHVDLPPMKHDVLGFDHSIIMSTIRVSLNRARGRPVNESEVTNLYTPEVIEIEFNKKYAHILPTQEEDDAFMDFLGKRIIEKKRRRKLHAENLDYTRDYEEYNSNEVSNDDDSDYDDFDDIESHEL